MHQRAIAILAQLGSNIKKIRIKRRLTQAKLAQKCCLDRSYISNVEKGKRNISTLRLNKIAKVLKVHICELLQDGDEEED